jgi:hypothetical protein
VPTLCTTFRKEAGFVWNRMQKASKLRLSLSEETITECALYDIAIAHQYGEIIIRPAKKPAEHKHGADWEWWLVHGKKGLPFRIQAKRLFPSGRYQGLIKDGYTQLNKLVSASQTAKCEPLYCFYNFPYTPVTFNGPNLCGCSYRAPSFWGCALAFPDQIKKLIPTNLQSSSRLCSRGICSCAGGRT